MDFIEFYQDQCDGCFKCLRICPTKAISFTQTRREIIDELCIKCGLCQLHCSHGALKIHQDLRRVKHALASGQRVVASLAPSYLGAFNLEGGSQLVAALKHLGFTHVEETARGADLVSACYDAHIGRADQDIIITSCCPASNALIVQDYPRALASVLPVVSPMLAHGFDIKRRWGTDCYVVFIGPCVAKKAEALDIPGAIDAAITFIELEEWLEEVGLKLEDLEPSAFDIEASPRGQAYPLGASLLRADLKGRLSPHYQYMHIEGIEACRAFLGAVEAGELHHICAELNICSQSCLNGPEMPSCAPSLFRRRQILENATFRHEPLQIEANVHDLPLIRTFKMPQNSRKPISEDQVSTVLMEMGKYALKDQINCGACGYTTCHDKAVAVARGYSDIDMCIERLKAKAESLQTIIFESSPNAICILDDAMRIQEANPAFHNIFNKDKVKLQNWPVAAVIGSDLMEEVQASHAPIFSKKLYLDQVDHTFFLNVVSRDMGKIYVAIFTDVSEAELNRLELLKVKEETLKTCQEVIDKQMRVAQEIASLLGETTAETKVGLNQLKKLVLTEPGGLATSESGGRP